jgi:hypothetical protein
MSKIKKVKKVKCGRVTHVGISRLFNLGNYCNRKIEIGAEVAQGQSASETMRRLFLITERLRPLRKPSCAASYEAAVKKAAEEQSEYEKANLPSWIAEMGDWTLATHLRLTALQELDDLGGHTDEKDAKTDWDIDDTPF